MSLNVGTDPSRGTTMVLNGTNVGPVTVQRVVGQLDPKRALMSRDGQDHIYFTVPNAGLATESTAVGTATAGARPTYVATGEHLNLTTYKKNILMVDGRRVEMIAVDNKVQSLGEATQNTLRKLPRIASPATVGIVTAGAVTTALIRGVRSPRTLLITGVVAAGVAGIGAVGLSFFRARHPDALPGWLK